MLLKETRKIIIKHIKKALRKRNLKRRNKVFSDELKSYLKPYDIITEEFRKSVNSYWSKYTEVNSDYHRLYTSRSGIEDVKYIPSNIYFNYIVPFYNNLELAKSFSDKSYSSLLFKELKRPIVIAKNINGIIYDDNFNIMTFDEMLNKSSENQKIIIKPSIDSGSGKSIVFIESKNKSNMKKKVKRSLESYESNYVIQEIIKQHEVMKSLNPSSVNTIRVMSFLNEEGVNILSPHVRIGSDNNEVDHNGIVCGISNNGVIHNFAIDYNNREKLFKHPQNYEFKGVTIPGFDKIGDIVKKEHLKLGHFRIISWDFSIDEEEEPVLIEINLRAPGIDNHQLTSGPLFEELTDQVLDEVFSEK